MKAADKIILPGVGNFRHGMDMLHSFGLVEPLHWFGLGGQIVSNASEEGDRSGLGWLDVACQRRPIGTVSQRIGVSVTTRGDASVVAAGNLFVYKGKHRAVLISYPENDELEGRLP